MNRLKTIALILHLLSMMLLIPGLFKDMLQIDITAHFFIDLNLFKENKSIVGTLDSLWGSKNYMPFGLILLFGIIIPLAKSIMIFYLLLAPKPLQQYHLLVNTISKWAMADVFVISIFTAYLGANAMQNTSASLQSGFYFFAGYVLFSAVTSSLIGKNLQNQPAHNV